MILYPPHFKKWGGFDPPVRPPSDAHGEYAYILSTGGCIYFLENSRNFFNCFGRHYVKGSGAGLVRIQMSGKFISCRRNMYSSKLLGKFVEGEELQA